MTETVFENSLIEPKPTLVSNPSGVRALGRAVLVRPDSLEEKTTSGIILTKSAGDRNAMVEQRATVIQIGDNAWMDEPAPRAKPGDRVIITQYAGHLVVGPKDGLQYRLINDRDIFAALED